MSDQVAPHYVARQVIDPKAYAQWDGLLDTFDWLRENMPVARIEPGPEAPGLFPPFWLVTRYDDVMRVSKDNAHFLNAPRATVFTTKEGEALARAQGQNFAGSWIERKPNGTYEFVMATTGPGPKASAPGVAFRSARHSLAHLKASKSELDLLASRRGS